MALTKINNNTLSAITGLPAAIATGKVLQVVQTVKTTDFSSSTSSGTAIDITGLSAAITPSSTSNKILISYDVYSSSTTSGTKIQLMRDSTKICINTSTSGFEAQTSIAGVGTTNAQFVMSYSFLDSPSSTSSITYKPQISHSSGGTQTIYVNRPESTSANHGRFTSQITLMEVAG